MEIPLLSDILIILGCSVVVVLLFQRFRLPTILGFLITGVVVGPNGFGFIEASHEVEILAEIGVILLLFIIGLEFSLSSLAAIQRTVFVGGTLQVAGTIGATALVFYAAKMPLPGAVFLGFLLSLSSTAIVLKILQEKGEVGAPHGRIALAILIFQDIVVVPMMLFTPMLAGQSGNVVVSLLLLLAKGLFIIGFVIASARYVVPRLMYAVARTRSKELFVLTTVVLCFSVALLTSSMGLSLALGAFLAGLIISESEYSHQATSNVLPFREIFASIFFVSVGMLLDVQFLLRHLPMIGAFTLATVLAKGLLATLAALALKYPPRTVIMVGLSLCQVGEFAFILSKTGLEYELLTNDVYQYFLSVSILTMGLTPFLINRAGAISVLALKAPLFRRVKAKMPPAKPGGVAAPAAHDYNDHLVIIGYGINGKNVARAAREAHIPYVIIELNPETIRQARSGGEPILYGDATGDTILSHVQVHKARVVVVAISDPGATKKIITNIRSFSQKVYIIIRTRFVLETEENLRLGADEVIPEEFETSIEIFTRVLTRYYVPEDQVEAFVRKIRSDNYEMLRPVARRRAMAAGAPLDFPEMDMVALTVQRDHDGIVGRKISESDVRKNWGVMVLAIKRNHTYITDINPDTRILHQDILYVFGKPDGIAAFSEQISA
jgi:CPA2 family monovalent cation:H+ antiporter-2